jgi:1-acyl-sn-glycerol-3-phosphate acyltransferase
MVYRILYYIANFFIRVYYRKIHTYGLNDIPTDKPLFIVSNHPNGFLEPIIMACLFPVDLHFLVRGDLFEKKALRWLLLSTNQIPIFRFRDGFAGLRNNQKTIHKTIEILKQNKAVIIFAEGSTDKTRYLRPFKKGMARMAFQCMDGSQDLDLHILPVGVTFSKASVPGSEVILNVGKAFSARDYYAKNAKEAKVKMDDLTEAAYEEVKKLILHTENREDDTKVNQAWQTYSTPQNSKFLPRVTYDSKIFAFLKSIVNKLNEGTETNLLDVPLARHMASRSNSLHRILFPFSFLGVLLWFIPIYTGFRITKKLVKQEEFQSSVRSASCTALSLIYVIVIFVVVSLLWNAVWALIFISILFILGGTSLYYWEREGFSLDK